jgi:hypothetical protein
MVSIIIIISALIAVVAACVTARYARSIHKMASEMRSKDEEYHRKMNELHNRIVSGLLSSNAEKIEIEMMDVELEVLKKFRAGKNTNFKKKGIYKFKNLPGAKLVANITLLISWCSVQLLAFLF